MHTTRLFALAVIALFALSAFASASVPPMINYQGKLMQPNGTPVTDGTYSITFTIYDAETAGNIRWSEPDVSVQVKGGLFSVLLGGNGTNLPANIFDSPDRWFGVKINDDPEMLPRQKIASVAYANKAESSDVALTVPDGSITTEKLADQSITAEKLVPGAATPAGTISMFAGATPPAGWLICNGSAVPRTEYAALFAVIGSTYGAGDGSTTFNLPGLAGRVPVGISMETEFNALGKMGGSKTHTLSASEMPAHNHIDSGHSHGVYDPGHTHAGYADTNKPYQWSSGTNQFRPALVTNTSGLGAYNCLTSSTTGLSVNSGASGIQSAGGGAAHNNLQPYLVVTYIIKI